MRAATTLYELARSICQERGAKEAAGETRHGWTYGFCEACLDEAMSRWDGVARLVAETHQRAVAAEVELKAVEQIARQYAPLGCLPRETEAVRTTVMRTMSALSSVRGVG